MRPGRQLGVRMRPPSYYKRDALARDRNVVRRHGDGGRARRARRTLERLDEPRRVPREIRRHRPRDREPPSRRAALRGGRRRARSCRRHVRRDRRHRGHGGPGSDRQPRRRRRDRQSARLCDRTNRSTPSTICTAISSPRFSTDAERRRIRFSRCSFRAATRNSSRSTAHVDARHRTTRTTMPPAKRSTKPRALLGLPFPGGPALDALARTAIRGVCVSAPSRRARRARPLVLRPQDVGTLFSGIRRRKGRRRADVAASFQAAVVDVLIDALDRALERATYRAVVLSGGVAANSALQAPLPRWSERTASGVHPARRVLHRQRRDDRRRRLLSARRTSRRPARTLRRPKPPIRVMDVWAILERITRRERLRRSG